jgi:hypothetical protein
VYSSSPVYRSFFFRSVACDWVEGLCLSCVLAYLCGFFHFVTSSVVMCFVPPRCLYDILRCGVYGTFAMAYHEM